VSWLVSTGFGAAEAVVGYLIFTVGRGIGCTDSHGSGHRDAGGAMHRTPPEKSCSP